MSTQIAAARTVRLPLTRTGTLGLLSAGHVVDDIYQGAVPALIPFFVAARHWDYAAASGITLAATALSVTQPGFGLLTDRHRLAWLVPAGMAAAGVGIGLSGLSSSYLVTFLAVALSGLGVAAYHPEAARIARSAAGASHVAMSWFSVAGNLGFTLGPLVVAIVLSAIGTAGTLPLMVPALLCAAVTFVLLRRLHPEAEPGPQHTSSSPSKGMDDWPGFVRLSVAAVARSIVSFGLATFVALYVEHRLGVDATIGDIALVTFYAAGTAGTFLGGTLAGRWGRVRIVRVAYLAAVPCLVALCAVSGPALFVAVAATGLVIYVPFSLHLTLGQDCLPSRVATASSVPLGLAVAAGGLATPLLGVLADAMTLRDALGTLTFMPVLALAVTLTLREPSATLRRTSR